MQILALQLVGVILICVVVANFFAPKKMRWTVNLEKTEPVFRQVFNVHCVYLLGCVFGMALLCLFLPHQLLEEAVGKALLTFMAFFWTTRVFVQFFYYDKSIRQEYPVFNVIFGAAFIYIALCLGTLSWMCWCI